MDTFPIRITDGVWDFEGTAQGLTYSEDLQPTPVIENGEVVDFIYDKPPIRKGSVTVHGEHAVPSGHTMTIAFGVNTMRFTGVKVTETRPADGNVVVDFEWEERAVV